MGVVQTILSLGQIGWLGTPGQDSASSESAGGRSRAFNPAGAKTPEEALAYIQLLYKAGRTDELVGLLRRSPVFREAWQTLQQFSAPGSEAAGVVTRFSTAAPDRAGLPAPPGVGSQDQPSSPGQNLATPAYPVLAIRPTRSLAAGRQVYETQARFYALEGANSPRISLRV